MQNYLKQYDSLFNKQYILNLNKEGKNLKQISEILNIPVRRLGELVKYYDLNLNKRILYNVKHDFFEIIDSELKAYILGFLVADGNISKKEGNRKQRISFNNAIDDYEILSLIQQNICPDTKIYFIDNQQGVIKRKLQCRLRFVSQQISDDLQQLNIIPNKTKNITFRMPVLKDIFLSHFIRGFFDGDGHVNKNCLTFVSTSKKFLEDIADYFKLPFRIIEEKNKSVYYRLCLNINKNTIHNIYDKLYKNSNYFLNRKKIKFNISNTEIN